MLTVCVLLLPLPLQSPSPPMSCAVSSRAGLRGLRNLGNTVSVGGGGIDMCVLGMGRWVWLCRWSIALCSSSVLKHREMYLKGVSTTW